MLTKMDIFCTLDADNSLMKALSVTPAMAKYLLASVANLFGIPLHEVTFSSRAKVPSPTMYQTNQKQRYHHGG